jgi:hypothetical protein
MDEEMITITKKEYDRLKKRSLKLQALDNAGVDNWDGYSYAMELLDGEEE